MFFFIVLAPGFRVAEEYGKKINLNESKNEGDKYSLKMSTIMEQLCKFGNVVNLVTEDERGDNEMRKSIAMVNEVFATRNEWLNC